MPAQSQSTVKIVAGDAFILNTPKGPAAMPFDASLDWSRPQPKVTRAVIVFHGKSRDVDAYYRSITLAAGRVGSDANKTSILIAPQFLNPDDAKMHHLPDSVLRWDQGTWESGADSVGALAVSSFEVIDCIIGHLADRKLFPNLTTIVLAGHSGGGQAIQRYAIVGRAEEIARPNIHLRYVVANAGSYMYFTRERPNFDGNAIKNTCPAFDEWRYGPRHISDKYVQESAARGWQVLEDEFASKDVVYLLGTSDTDAHEKDLDVSCAAELQGPNRLLRGKAYFTWMRQRHLMGWNQQLWLVPEVAHSGPKMFTSNCGVTSLFKISRCESSE